MGRIRATREVERIHEYALHCREKADTTTNEKLRIAYLQQCRRAMGMKQSLMIDTGLIPKAAEVQQVYKAVVNLRPDDGKTEQRFVGRSREEVLNDLFDKLSKATVL